MALVAVIVVGVGLLAVNSRTDYGTFAFWGVPERIDYCERRYYPALQDVTGTPEQFTASLGGERQWRTVGHTYSRRPIYAVVTLDPDRTVCTMDLYVATGTNRYRHFGLSGSP